MTSNGHKYELAKAGDPLIDSNGELLLEEDGMDDVNQPLPSPQASVPFKHYRSMTKRVISDLRAPVEATNVAAVVFVYTLLGISDAEICMATKLTGQDIMKVRELRCYSEMFEKIMGELINANSEYIEARIAAYSGMALNNVADIAARARAASTRLSASKDLLDRAGHRPQDQSMRTGVGLNELHIVVTKAKDAPDAELQFKLNPGEDDAHSS